MDSPTRFVEWKTGGLFKLLASVKIKRLGGWGLKHEKSPAEITTVGVSRSAVSDWEVECLRLQAYFTFSFEVERGWDSGESRALVSRCLSDGCLLGARFINSNFQINQIKLEPMRRLYFTEEHWRKEGWCLPPHYQII